MTLFVLNSPILTSYGHYLFSGPIKIEEARSLLQGEFMSAVGHQVTADMLSEILGINVPYNRTRIEMKPGDKALIFRLLQRVSPGEINDRTVLEQVGYEMSWLERTS